MPHIHKLRRIIQPQRKWRVGFNFRNTLAFVTDPLPDTVFWANELYPTVKLTAEGFAVSAGWISATNGPLSDVNGSASGDPRIAGEVDDGQNGTGNSVFKIDLPRPGWYMNNVGYGSSLPASFASCSNAVYDGTQAFAQLQWQVFQQAISSGNILDAMGTSMTLANWPTQNVGRKIHFSSKLCIVKVGNASDSGHSPIAHFHLSFIS